MRARSPQRAAAERIYLKRARLFLTEHEWCESPKGCPNRSEQVHHRAGRSGWRLLDETRWSALCAPCHKHFTEHPTEAYELGISERRVGRAS